jgi:FkbM family methyltransferase
MRYFFIDLGAYTGDSFLQFMARTDLPVPPQEFEVYLVEPNPNMFTVLDKMFQSFDNINEIIKAAAWIGDGEADFAVDTNDLAYGSTLMSSKKEIWDKFAKQKVETFNFSRWITQFKNDYVIVKCDVEGAEFPILEKMMDEDTDKIMDELWIELHPNKLVDYTTDDSNVLIQKLVNRGVKVELWH